MPLRCSGNSRNSNLVVSVSGYTEKMRIKRNKSGKIISYLCVIIFLLSNSYDEYFELIPAG